MGQKELDAHIEAMGVRGGPPNRMKPFSLRDGQMKREMMIGEMSGKTGNKDHQLKWKKTIEDTLMAYKKNANPVAVIMMNPAITDVLKKFCSEWINKELLKNVQFMEHTDEPAFSVLPMTRAYGVLFNDFVESLKLGDHPMHPTIGELRMLYIVRRYTNWGSNTKERDRKKKRRALSEQVPLSQQPEVLSEGEASVVKEMRSNPFLKDAFIVMVSDPSLRAVFRKRFHERRNKKKNGSKT